jgi:hypothetical protein
VVVVQVFLPVCSPARVATRVDLGGIPGAEPETFHRG